MQIFTIRKSLHKIKLWENVRHDSNIYQALLTTRSIDISDLFVYQPLITVNSLPHTFNFEYAENETMENATELRFYNLQHRMDNVIKPRAWTEAQPKTYDLEGFKSLNLYSEEELLNISHNLLPENADNQIEIPLKEFYAVEEVEEKIYTQTIPVDRIII